ncbi:uncharacterized protein LOC124900855 [Homo sapiens]|uniref:uncharacterized protein LOC124900855 n=1 Tax=Homo sapiens TaxID=9606 RepID=UPI001FB06817|nr:uncharacterized protein LOC124900855 [Homo sapiens]XP_047300284.1 uncharacterized protein LOC124900855 [Homo sapiens]
MFRKHLFPGRQRVCEAASLASFYHHHPAQELKKRGTESVRITEGDNNFSWSLTGNLAQPHDWNVRGWGILDSTDVKREHYLLSSTNLTTSLSLQEEHEDMSNRGNLEEEGVAC